jgi:carbon monoxide dehydrogenase subunit G
MAGIRVSTTIDATPADVWGVVEHVGDHVEWMHDAVAIRFTSECTQGAGTTFDCDTKIGPLRLTDRMEITSWEPETTMGVHHIGVVTGTGEFTLEPVDDAHTRFTWHEQLTFPWWMGGPLGALAGGQVLKLVWKRNLRQLKTIVEGRESA